MYVIMNLMYLEVNSVGHDMQTDYYLTLTTHIQVVSTYWII